MGRHLFAIALSLTLALALAAPGRARADSVREFVMSCSYGAIAGTLVGAATLAFTDHPGDNLNKVARGASLGLYAGMLLGAYVVWGAPDDSRSDDDFAAFGPPFSLGGGIERARPAARSPVAAPKLVIFPVLSERGLEGAALRYSVLSF